MRHPIEVPDHPPVCMGSCGCCAERRVLIDEIKWLRSRLTIERKRADAWFGWWLELRAEKGWGPDGGAGRLFNPADKQRALDAAADHPRGWLQRVREALPDRHITVKAE